MSLETEAWLHPHKQPEAIPYNLGALQTNSSLLTRIALKQISKDQEGARKTVGGGWRSQRSNKKAADSEEVQNAQISLVQHCQVLL